MVLGDDPCLRGRGFESWHRILDGHDIFSHLIVKIVLMFVIKDRNK